MSAQALSRLQKHCNATIHSLTCGFFQSSKTLCQEGEQPEEKKASKREEKAAKSRWSLSGLGKGTRDIKVSASSLWASRVWAGGSACKGCVQAAPRDTSAYPQTCNLAGWWKNDLGSKMQVFKVGNDGTFSGEYHTAVSSTQKPIQPSPLTGSQHLDEDGQCTFGFTVNWSFSGL